MSLKQKISKNSIIVKSKNSAAINKSIKRRKKARKMTTKGNLCKIRNKVLLTKCTTSDAIEILGMDDSIESNYVDSIGTNHITNKALLTRCDTDTTISTIYSPSPRKRF